jgi:RimJ/RimL family protein N-acetyltransferase
VLVPTYPIATTRLTLRPFHKEDVEDFYAYASRAEVATYLYWEPRDPAEARQAVEDKLAMTAIRAEGDRIVLAVEGNEAGRLIGEVTLVWRSRPHRQGEIGFVFNPDYQRHGFATEATAALMELGFDVLGLHRIFGCCDARNHRSASLMERLGMRKEAHLVHNEIFKGEWGDELIYAVLDDQWRARM